MNRLLFLIGIITSITAILGVYTLVLSKKKSSEPYVYYINYKPESDTILQELAKLYTEKTGIKVTVISNFVQKYGEILSKGISDSNQVTLFVEGGLQQLAQYADYAYDLTGTKIAAELNTDDYKLIDKEGKLVGIGYCFETFGLIVNTELLEKAGYNISDI